MERPTRGHPHSSAVRGSAAGVGRTGLPADWIEGLREWPRSVAWMGQLAEVLESGRSQRPLGLPAAGVLMRNLLFLSHGFRRLLPPY